MLLLSALGMLNNDCVKLLVAGDGPEKKTLVDLSSSLGLENKVVFVGLKRKFELLELYNLADVFVLASYSEGLPRVLIGGDGLWLYSYCN